MRVPWPWKWIPAPAPSSPCRCFRWKRGCLRNKAGAFLALRWVAEFAEGPESKLRGRPRAAPSLSAASDRISLRGTIGKVKTSDRSRDVRRLAKLFPDGGYSYQQSKYLIAETRWRSISSGNTAGRTIALDAGWDFNGASHLDEVSPELTKHLRHTGGGTGKARQNPNNPNQNPDSLRRGASQAAGAAPTLRYGPTGDSAPRLRLKAAGMTERFPFGPSARPETPLFPREQYVSPDRPAAVQGAKRRSEPLTARTDLESSRARGKGVGCRRGWTNGL